MHITTSHVNTIDGRLLNESVLILKETICYINSHRDNVSFVIITGDITNNGSAGQFEKAMSILDELNVTYYTGIGNHDCFENKDDYQNYFGRLHYSFTYNQCHFIIIDSCLIGDTRGNISCTEMVWLQSDLEAHKNASAIFVFCHHSPLAGIYPESRVIINGKHLLDLLHRYENTFVFNGHLHLNEIIRKNGTWCITTSALIQYPCQFRKIDVYTDRIIITAYWAGVSNTNYWAKKSLDKGADKASIGKIDDQNRTILFEEEPTHAEEPGYAWLGPLIIIVTTLVIAGIWRRRRHYVSLTS